jgi:high-affinity Fe2+/Pb2+ permease
MAASAAVRKGLARRSLEVWLAPSLAGLSLFVVVSVLGFEEPNGWLLIVAASLALATPIAVGVHLYRTTVLTGEEKRFWIREFTSFAAASALADYVTATDHRAVTRARMERRSPVL